MSRSPRRPQPHLRQRIAATAASCFTVLALFASAFAPLTAGAATSTSPTPASKALDYVASCQRSDGGFAEKSASASSESLTAWTIVALASAGQDPNLWKSGGHSPVEYLASKSSQWKSVTDFARTLLAVRAAGGNVRSFGGVDLVSKIRDQSQDHGASGNSYGPYINTHIWALIALDAAGERARVSDVDWLVGQQGADGGWGWAPGQASDTNDTAAAIQALMACGKTASSDPVSRGLAYLRAKQNSDAGFSYSTGASDANSSAWVIQAILATGQDPGASAWKRGSASPVSALVALQRTEGSFRYTSASTSNPLLSTVQAIPPLSAQPFPLKNNSRSATFGAKPVVSMQSPVPGSVVASSTSATLKLTVSDAAGTGIDSATLKVKVDGKSAKTKLTGTSASVGPVALKSGSHTVAVTVSDNAGNSVSNQQFTFTVAAVNPGVTYSSTWTTRTLNAGVQASGTYANPLVSGRGSLDASASTFATSPAEKDEASATPTARAPKRRSTLPYVVAAVVAAAGLVGAVWAAVWWVRRRRAKGSAL